MGKIVADALGGELDVVLTRKLARPAIRNSRSAPSTRPAGATSPSTRRAPARRSEYLDAAIAAEMQTMRRRRAEYTPVRPPLDPAGRVAIVVDDGLATGATMIAALHALRARQSAPADLRGAGGLARGARQGATPTPTTSSAWTCPRSSTRWASSTGISGRSTMRGRRAVARWPAGRDTREACTTAPAAARLPAPVHADDVLVLPVDDRRAFPLCACRTASPIRCGRCVSVVVTRISPASCSIADDPVQRMLGFLVLFHVPDDTHELLALAFDRAPPASVTKPAGCLSRIRWHAGHSASCAPLGRRAPGPAAVVDRPRRNRRTRRVPCTCPSPDRDRGAGRRRSGRDSAVCCRGAQATGCRRVSRSSCPFRNVGREAGQISTYHRRRSAHLDRPQVPVPPRPPLTRGPRHPPARTWRRDRAARPRGIVAGLERAYAAAVVRRPEFVLGVERVRIERLDAAELRDLALDPAIQEARRPRLAGCSPRPRSRN